MKFFRIWILLIISISLYPSSLYAQQVFSKTEFGYKGIFQPYDLPAMVPVGVKDFVMLRQFNRNTMELCRYDQYLFEVWAKTITFDVKLSVPQIFMKGDSVMLFSTKYTADSCEIDLHIYNSGKGELISRMGAAFPAFSQGDLPLEVALSKNHSKMMVYNYSSSADSVKAAFTIIDLTGSRSPVQLPLPEQGFLPSATGAYISENGNILYVAADAEERKIHTWYRSTRTGEWVNVSVDYIVEDANISEINIQPLGATSWFVTYSVASGTRLAGAGVLGVNIILKSVLYNDVISFTESEVGDLYSHKEIVNSKGLKSIENPYTDMDNFHLTQTYRTPENSLIVIFEQQEMPTQFHKEISMSPMSWDYTINEDRVVKSGDVLIYCFSDMGEVLWKKAVVKRQEAYGTNLGISHISALYGSNLSLMGHTGKDFFALTLKTTDGSVTRKLDPLPGKDNLFTKRYSCWLDGYSVVMCGISLANDGLRKLMLVEF